MKKEMENTNKLIETLLSRIEKLEQSNEQLREKYNKLLEDGSFTNDYNPDMIMHMVTTEMKETEIRKKNIMIFGLQEKNCEGLKERRQHDANLCNQIMKELKVDDFEILHTQRMGKIRSDGKRPLKVVLSRTSAKQKIMKNAKELRKTRFADIFINNDLTPFQQARAKQTRVELKERRKRGEDVVIYRGQVVTKASLKNFR